MKADGEFAPRPWGPATRRIRPIDVCLYDAATGAEVQRLPGRYDSFVFPEFSPDGRTVAYHRLEPEDTNHVEVVLWDVLSGRERAVLRAPHQTQNPNMHSGVGAPSFSPDGTTLIQACTITMPMCRPTIKAKKR